MCRRDRPLALTSSPEEKPTLDASTISSRQSAMSVPRISSERPAAYTSAQSKKLIPTSRQRRNIAAEVFSSAVPPNDIVPKHSRETLIPVLPNVRYSICSPL